MPKQFVRQLFVDGMNDDMDEAAIDLAMQGNVVTRVSSTTNMVFERGLVITRPPITQYTIGNFAANAYIMGVLAIPRAYTPTAQRALVIAFQAGAIVLYRMSLTATSPIGTLTALTGVALGAVTTGPFSLVMVNQVALITGIGAGLIRWDPAGNPYTVIATNWRYVTKLFSRAIGAYSTAGGVTDPIKVGASKSGDETDWVSTGAYSNILSDIPDEITGLGVIKGTVVVPRRYGFHLGTPTGQSPAIYNWASYCDVGVGAIPGTFQIYNNVGYFVSEIGVHSFDLVNMTEIGEGITQELTLYLQQSFPIQTWIAMAYRQDLQPTYNILCNNIHFMYNIKERKWSRHTYIFAASVTGVGLNLDLGSVSVSAPCIGLAENKGTPAATKLLGVLRGGNYTSGVSEGGLEAAGTIVFPTITLQPSYQDTFLTRVLIVIKAPVAASSNFAINVTSVLNNVSNPIAFTPSGTVSQTAGWNAFWFSGRCAGQQFQVTLTLNVGTATPCKIKEVWYEFSTSATQRT